MTLPADTSLAEVQAALRSLSQRVEQFERGNVEFHGRRIINAGDAQAGGDYVTLRQLRGQSEQNQNVSQIGTPGGGDEVRVNGVDIVNVIDLNDLTPQPPVGFNNVEWQKDSFGTLVSARYGKRPDVGIFGATIFGNRAANSAGLTFIPGDNNAQGSGSEAIMPVGGWLRSPHIYTQATQGDLASILEAIYDEGSVSLLKFSIPPKGVSGVYSNLTTALRLEKGESFRWNWKQIGGSTGGVNLNTLSSEFATDDGSVIIYWAAAPTNTTAASTTEYLSPFSGVKHSSASESRAEIICPFPGTARNFIIYSTTSQPPSGSLVITVRKNGGATAITFTIAASGTAGSHPDFTHSFSVAKGDRLTLEVVNNATTVSCRYHWVAFTVLPDSALKTSILGGAINAAVSSSYAFFFQGLSSTAEIDTQIAAPRDGILRYLSVNRVTGSIETATARVNGVNTDLALVIPAAEPAGHISDTTHSVAVKKEDLISLAVGGGASMWGWTMEFAGA